ADPVPAGAHVRAEELRRGAVELELTAALVRTDEANPPLPADGIPAARRMHEVEREALDPHPREGADRVIGGGCKHAEVAEHLTGVEPRERERGHDLLQLSSSARISLRPDPGLDGVVAAVCDDTPLERRRWVAEGAAEARKLQRKPRLDWRVKER